MKEKKKIEWQETSRLVRFAEWCWDIQIKRDEKGHSHILHEIKNTHNGRSAHTLATYRVFARIGTKSRKTTPKICLQWLDSTTALPILFLQLQILPHREHTLYYILDANCLFFLSAQLTKTTSENYSKYSVFLTRSSSPARNSHETDVITNATSLATKKWSWEWKSIACVRSFGIICNTLIIF
jgi:hypothetical protein